MLFRSITNLIVLRLRSSEFKGYIPQQICQLSFLMVLDLANNSLSGSIPNCLKNISVMASPDFNIISFSSMSFIYSYIYGSYVENVQLVPKEKEMEYEENLILVRLIDLSVTTCPDQSLLKFQIFPNYAFCICLEII